MLGLAGTEAPVVLKQAEPVGVVIATEEPAVRVMVWPVTCLPDSGSVTVKLAQLR